MKPLLLLQKQINNATSFCTVTLPPGTLDVAELGRDGIVVDGKEWIVLKGHENGTVVTNSIPGGSVLTIRNSAMCRVVGPFGIDAPVGGVGLILEWDGKSNYNTLGNKISDLRVRGGRYGIQIGTGYAHSTSENRIVDCQISNQAEACICVDAGNGQNNWLIGGYTIGTPVGILVKKGVIHTAMGTCSVIHSDCVIKYENTPLTASSFHGHYAEQTPKFIDIPGPTGQRAPMVLVGCQLYCGTEVWGKTTDVIVNRGIGPLAIVGCEVGIKGFPNRIVVDAGAHSPVAVIGTAFWDNRMGNFSSDSQTGGFNIQSCVNMYSDDTWATPLARPFFANESGVNIACLSNTQQQVPAKTQTAFTIDVCEWFVGSSAPWSRGAYTIGHPFSQNGEPQWWPQTVVND